MPPRKKPPASKPSNNSSPAAATTPATESASTPAVNLNEEVAATPIESVNTPAVKPIQEPVVATPDTEEITAPVVNPIETPITASIPEVPEPPPQTTPIAKTPKAAAIAVAVDIGNHCIKVAQDNQTCIADSLYAEVIHSSQVGELDEASTFIRYLEGDRQDLIGRQWITGNDAGTYFSDTVQRAVDGMNNSGKVTLGLQLLLGHIRPPQFGARLVIKYLFATLPDVEVLGSAFTQAIKGTHTIEQTTIHHHTTFTVEIQEVILKEEGQGAIAYALAKGICVQGAWNATIDWGGGTTITQAYNERGQIVPSSRLVQGKGVNDLAAAIASDQRFRKHLGKVADMGLILAAIRNGSLRYGGQGFDFAEIYHDQHRVWLSSIALPAFRKLLTLQDRLKTTLLIGGGAHLAKSLERSSVVICSRPDLANVEGLMILAKIRLGEAN